MSVFRSFEVLLGKKYKCVTKLSLKHQGRLKILCFTVTEQKSRKHESRRFTVMNTFDANMLPVTVQGGPPPPSFLSVWLEPRAFKGYQQVSLLLQIQSDK